MWEGRLPHTRLYSEHIPAVLSEEFNSVPPTGMLQWRGESHGELEPGIGLLDHTQANKAGKDIITKK